MKNDRSLFSKTSAPIVFVCHHQLFGRGSRQSQTKPPLLNDGKGGWVEIKRQMGGTKPMELLNKVNGIVERNQWNRWTKSMGLAFENDGLACGNWRNDCFSPTISHVKSETCRNGKNWQHSGMAKKAMGKVNDIREWKEGWKRAIWAKSEKKDVICETKVSKNLCIFAASNKS